MSLRRIARIACAALLLAGGGFALYEAVEAPGSQAIAGVIDHAPSTTPHAPRVALTFDDGPDALVTPHVLDVLHARHAVATFFVVGEAAHRHPELVRRALRDGNEIENHTRTHAHLDWLGAAQAAAEMRAGSDEIATITGRRPRYLRPPFGRRSAATVHVADSQGLRVVTWTYEPRTLADVSATVAAARDGSIILLHDGDRGRDDRAGSSAEATLTAPLIDGLRARGITIVTLDDLLREVG